MAVAAGGEGWPKDKLREKINTIRTERAHLQRTLDENVSQPEVGRQVLLTALDLFDTAGAVYRHANETVRTTLNRAFFTRLEVEGEELAGQSLREPFDVLTALHQRSKTYQTARIVKGPALTEEVGVLGDRATLIDSLAPVLWDGF